MVSSQSIHSRTSSRRSSESRAKPFFPPWTLEQSFFAASGGITVDTSTFWPHPTLTFTPAGVLELAKAGLLPSLPLSEVKDKSKTDVIATILVSIQSIWFIAQCFARLARHLPLTLLEIHTLVQLLCILTITIIWAKKPYNPVARALPPTTHERLLDMAALFAIDPHLLPTTLNPHKNRLVYPVDITEATQAYTTAASAATTTTDRKPALPFTPASPEIDHSKIAALHTRASRALDHLRRRHRAAVISSPVGQSPPPPSLTFACPHVVRARSDRVVQLDCFR
ncbi:hypothetical protein GTA08_BOTSDO03750 [Neofusicoccum parvum]|uniref:Uncharacterized protein n=1 Tax=Neofusicoccum parvum TaxID=310453 RepID=A0ACB5S7C5_9PEZI|nr:hypothetical protein GTA08_BOTSDO03750 [Neofusicoccum parvum]